MDISYEALLDLLAKHYPIGVLPTDPRYQEHPGMKESILNAKRMVETEFSAWQAFVESFQLESEEVLEVGFGISSGQSFQGSLLLYHEEFSGGIYFKTIEFNFSFLGPFFTVYGKESIGLRVEKRVSFTLEPVLVVSPVGFYEPWFRLVLDRMTREYNASFVPFKLLRLRVPSLYVLNADNQAEGATIYQALFSSGGITNYKHLDERLYRMNS